jgi:hypothetical protein
MAVAGAAAAAADFCFPFPLAGALVSLSSTTTWVATTGAAEVITDEKKEETDKNGDALCSRREREKERELY